MNKIIVVGTNSLTESQYPAYSNHCQMWFRFGRSYPQWNFAFVNPARMSIDRMRNMAAKVAIDSDAEYLLFIDDDVLVPPNSALEMLLACDSDVACGNVLIRGYPFDYMVFKENLITDKDEVVSLSPIKERGTGIEQVDAVGFSLCLIKVSLLKKVRPPYFITGPNFTEDVYFCWKARRQVPDCTIKINWELECGHILWAEVMTSETRLHYKTYFEAMNPGVEETHQKIKIYNQILKYEDMVANDMNLMKVRAAQ